MDHFITTFNVLVRTEKNNTFCDILNIVENYYFERVHSKFCKTILILQRIASNIGARIDFGRFTLNSFIKTQSILYFRFVKKLIIS